eukprot:gene16975-15715_t
MPSPVFVDISRDDGAGGGRRRARRRAAAAGDARRPPYVAQLDCALVVEVLGCATEVT